MAALALLGGTSIVVGRGLLAEVPVPPPAQQPVGDQTQGRDHGPPPAPSQVQAPKLPETTFPAVRLNLVIAGLGRAGCDVEVKPANAGCKFRTAAPRHVPSDGRAILELRDVELRGADHTCTLAITVREPGQSPKTLYRGFRLASRPVNPSASSASSSASSPIPSVTCYLSTRLAEVDGKRTRR
jgi:hypothetical protein